MKIKINELGAVKEGVLDLSKKLNVFCGPNGTGKTYVSYIIYGLLKSSIHIGPNRELVNSLIENKVLDYKIDFDVINDYRQKLIDNFRDEELDSLFGIGHELAKLYFSDFKIQYLETNEEFNSALVKSRFVIDAAIGKIDVRFTKVIDSEILRIEITDKTISTKDIEAFSFFFYTHLISLLSTFPISSTYILPVERNSIFTFSKELSIRKQEAVDHFHAMTGKSKIDKFELLFNKTTRYPLPIKDGLLVADDLSEIKKSVSPFFDFATALETELLFGTVEISNDGEIKFKPKRSPKKAIPIHMTASIIKSLSSLVIYLKHLAQVNDLIIIDEPEINLHPDNQIILTRLFMRLINKGFRLLVSTHSDYIIREINNLIMLSSDKPGLSKLAEQFHYSKDEFISNLDVNVLYFDYPLKLRGNKQVTIKNLNVDENGFEVPSLDKAIDDQNRISEELFYMLKYGEDEE